MEANAAVARPIQRATLTPSEAGAEAGARNGSLPLDALDAIDDLDELGDAIAELAAHIQAATFRLLCLIRRFDEAGGWVQAGARSCAEWLSWRVGLGPVAAREKVRVARALAELPRLSAAFASGELSYSKLRAVTRVATAENEETLLTYARHGTAAQVERIVRHYRGVLRAQAIERDNDRQAQRGLRTWVDDDGMLVIEGRLPPELGAVVLQALERAEAELSPQSPQPPASDDVSAETPAAPPAPRATAHDAHDEHAPDDSAETFAPPAAAVERPTSAQRRADALALVARSALDHEMRQGSGGDRTQIVLHVDAEALADPGAPGRCAIEGISDVSAQTALRLACDASVVTVVHGDSGQVLDVGRKTRSIPPAIRRALAARDHCCSFPGCQQRRHLQAHHVRHWATGGTTCLENLATLCPFHHRLVHEGGFTVRRDPHTGELRFARPDGRPLPVVPPAPRRSPGAAGAPGDALVATNSERGLQISAGTIACPTREGDLDYGWAVDLLLRADRGQAERERERERRAST